MRDPDSPYSKRRRTNLLHDLVPGRHADRVPGAVEGQRWSIGDAFQAVKTGLELAHDENLFWYGWYRHVSLVMMAFALLAVIRHHTNGLAHKSRSRLRLRAR